MKCSLHLYVNHMVQIMHGKGNVNWLRSWCIIHISSMCTCNPDEVMLLQSTVLHIQTNFTKKCTAVYYTLDMYFCIQHHIHRSVSHVCTLLLLPLTSSLQHIRINKLLLCIATNSNHG